MHSALRRDLWANGFPIRVRSKGKRRFSVLPTSCYTMVALPSIERGKAMSTGRKFATLLIAGITGAAMIDIGSEAVAQQLPGGARTTDQVCYRRCSDICHQRLHFCRRFGRQDCFQRYKACLRACASRCRGFAPRG